MNIDFGRSGIMIDGRWRGAADAALLPVEDPSTGATIGAIPAGDASDIDEAVVAARRALEGPWGRMSPVERGRMLSAIGRAVAVRAEDFAQIEARDVGKPLRQARADVLALARYLEFYGGAVDKLHGETIPYNDGYTVYTVREPHGVTGHIVPWNYPMQIVGRSVVAALAMGNAAVLKPAEQASLTAILFGRVAQEAGLPDGALNIVTGTGVVAGAALAAHPGVDHLSFTGSSRVGALVQAAAAPNAVAVTLELGGKSPQLVFADADLDRAIPFLVSAGIQNAGQTCSAGSRILVQQGVYDELAGRLAERFSALVAAPALDDNDLGPLISAQQRDTVLDYVAQGRRELTVLAEGRVSADAPSAGHYVAPVIFTTSEHHHRLFQEEIFGPAVVVTPFADEDEALALANATPYGLVAGVWTHDGGRQMRLARRLRAGQVFLNDYGAAGGVELPFGGVGRSGHGREKGVEALRTFSALKTVAAYHG